MRLFFRSFDQPWCSTVMESMESFEFDDNICRVCLDPNVYLHWCDYILENYDVTYKDCYYKYTHLEMPGLDHFSQVLCENCANDLKNLHILIETALDSHAKLQQAYADKSNIAAGENEESLDENHGDHVDGDTHLSDFLSEEEFEPNNFEIVMFEHENKEIADEGDQKDIKPNVGASNDELQGKRKTRGCKKSSPVVQKTNKQSNDGENDNDEMSNKTMKNENLNGSPSPKRERRSCKRPVWIDNGAFEVSIPKTILASGSQKEISAKKVKNDKNQVTHSKRIANQEAIKKMVAINKSESQGSLVHKRDSRKGKIRTLKKFQCSKCTRIFRYQSNLKRHEDGHDKIDQRTEICPHCNMKFFTKHVLMFHIKTHDLNREKYQCDFCQKSYLNKGMLAIHRRIHLGQMISCPLCCKEFYRAVDLERHNVRAHPELSHFLDPQKPKPRYVVYCKVCDKNVRTPSWKAHQAAHSNEPLMKCSMCNKEFFNRATCIYHMAKVHDIKKKDDYEPFIIKLKGKLTHLLLKQNGELLQTE